jgi:hypothetical protein
VRQESVKGHKTRKRRRAIGLFDRTVRFFDLSNPLWGETGEELIRVLRPVKPHQKQGKKAEGRLRLRLSRIRVTGKSRKENGGR